MPHQPISLPALSLRASTLRTRMPAKLPPLLFYVFFTITSLAIFIPLNPVMPTSENSDSSWVFGMNEAIARHLSFGKDIILTCGPYASIVTREYNPATALPMVCGSLLVGVSYAIALLYLARGRKRYLVLILLLFLATFGNPEMLFLSYSFLLVVCVLRQVESDHRNKAAALSWRQALAVVLMLSALGLAPLVKGSLLLPYLASVAIPTAFLLYRARFRDALLWLTVFV